MERWKLVLDEDAFHFLLARPAAQRRKLLAIFEKLRNDPHHQPDYRTKDHTGRDLSVLAARPFLITYWLDAAICEIRILDIQKVRD